MSVTARAIEQATRFIDVARAMDADFWSHASDELIANPALHVTMMALDISASTRAYSLIGNNELGALLKRSARAVQRNLGDLERLGFIERLMLPGEKKVRLGILLTKRIRPGKPAADTEARRANALNAVFYANGKAVAPEAS